MLFGISTETAQQHLIVDRIAPKMFLLRGKVDLYFQLKTRNKYRYLTHVQNAKEVPIICLVSAISLQLAGSLEQLRAKAPMYGSYSRR